MAVGDNLFHDVLFRPGEDGTFAHFEDYYEPVRHIIQSADVAFVNQETVFAGAERGFSSFPRFNTPIEAGLALIAAGFNVVNHANNHTMDMGERGAVATLDFWDAHPEVAMIGLYRSREDRDAPTIREVNGIRVGWLAYTYGLNGLPLPASRPYMVPLIDDDVIESEIAAIRPLVDFLAVSIHWGYEYRHEPNAEQRRLAALMANLGVDLIIGHHPHVLQPMEFLPREGEDGTLTENATLVVYSLGNFLSAQHDNNTLLGGLLFVEVRMEDGKVTMRDAGILPLVTHYELGFVNFRVFPLFDYTEELAAVHRNRVRADLGRANIGVGYFRDLAQRVLGDSKLDRDPFAPADEPAEARRLGSR